MKPTGVKEMSLIDAHEQEAPSTNVPMVREDDNSLMSTFERLAKDPSVDVDKFERLLAMHERARKQFAEEQFNTAMSDAQKEMRRISADAENPQTRSKYATYAKLDRALRPIYTDHGFGMSFNTGDGAPQDWVRVVCYVTHGAGHSRTYHIDMPADGKGAKGGDVMTKTHAVGAAASYGMRYLLKMIFNVAVGEEDRDGNTVEGQRPEPPKGFEKYWQQLVEASKKGTSALEAVWACSQDEPYKSYRKHIAAFGASDIAALKVQAAKITEAQNK